jgi:hypothetical protein
MCDESNEKYQLKKDNPEKELGHLFACVFHNLQ